MSTSMTLNDLDLETLGTFGAFWQFLAAAHISKVNGAEMHRSLKFLA